LTLFFNHEFAKSLEIANNGHLKSPRNPSFNRLAMYDNTDLKQFDDAIKSADLLFNKSDNPDFNYLDYRYYGQALRETKKFDLAIIQFKKAIETDSTKIDLWKDISDMYNDNSDYKNAISNYLTCMSLLPEDKKTADTSYNLGRLYYSLGNSDKDSADVKKSALLKADSVFAKVITLDPTNYRGYVWRARSNFSLDPETLQGLAKPFYEQTLPIVEAKADAKYNPVIMECCRYLGYYYYLKKDFTQSKMYWNKILALDPTNDMAIKAIDGIDKTMKAKK
jgi:tetratricopeptide (TPR) repeat protein